MAVLIPYEKFVIKTSFSSDEIKQKLSEVIEPYRMIRYTFSYDHKPYDGEIVGNNFKIRRVPDFRNHNFEIIVEGKVKGSTIECIIRNDWGTAVFMVFYFSLFGALILLELFTKQGFIKYWYMPPVMFILGYLGVLISFYPATNESKRFLCDLFKAKIN